MNVEQWVDTIFSHKDRDWYWKEDWQSFMPAPAHALNFLETLFRNSKTLLNPYSSEQVGTGLWFLGCVSCSTYSELFFDTSIDQADRLCAAESMANFFQDYFGSKKTKFDPSKQDDEQPYDECAAFMWWDIVYMSNKDSRDTETIRKVYLSVMETQLKMESRVCRFSGLHGLGHYREVDEPRVLAAIDSFLKENPYDQPLVAYAEKAREGDIQ